MSFFKEKYRVESTRKSDWDYRLPGWYFVTICTQRRICHFGSVVGSNVQLSLIGEFAENHWKALPSHYENVALDSFVVMPNHFHGIIVIGGEHAFSPTNGSAPSKQKGKGKFSSISPRAGSIAAIIRSYKAGVTLSCRRNGFTEFQWQPRFHDHIIRGRSLSAIRDYVQNNPANWDKDELNEVRVQRDVASYVSTEYL